jgi:hypothetical protein
MAPSTLEGIFWFAAGTLSLMCAAFPRWAFRTFEAWKFDDPDSVELNEAALAVRIAVALASAVGMYMLAVWLLFLDGPGFVSLAR